MPTLMSAWPVVALLLPALVLLSAVVFLAKGDRRSFSYLMALLACYLVGALLMEFFVFMAARMARPGTAQAVPVLGAGTKQLLETLSNPRSIAAPPLSLPAIAAYSVAGVLPLGAGELGAAPARQESGLGQEEDQQKQPQARQGLRTRQKTGAVTCPSACPPPRPLRQRRGRQ